MNLDAKITGLDSFVSALMAVATSITPSMEKLLDNAAADARNKMSEEAPKNYGTLSDQIDVSSPDALTRIISPLASNQQTHRPYAIDVESGTGSSGPMARPYFPNYKNLATYFGVTDNIGFAIAMAIYKRGTPANPFVKRTWEWIQIQISKGIEPYFEQLRAAYATTI
jgi:hypothetical protein